MKDPVWTARRSCVTLLLFAITTAAPAACRAQEAGSASAPSDPPDPAAVALLFGDDPGPLTSSEQEFIFASLLSLALAADGSSLVDSVCGQPAGASVEYPDLNADGTPEVLVTYGNTCTSGMAGSSVMLFIQRDGEYRPQLGFPAAAVEPLETSHLGYPDLRIGGPGFCFPVWRWNGTDYEFLREDPMEPGGCSTGR